MVLLEMSVVPVGKGESLGPYVARCVDIVEQSGLDYQLHAMGTIVEGELSDVLRVMQQCIEELAKDSERVTCTARLDYRKGVSGQIKDKVASVEQHLGRQLKK
jgi:uncharacterized protein (TIGR00106 family)